MPVSTHTLCSDPLSHITPCTRQLPQRPPAWIPVSPQYVFCLASTPSAGVWTVLQPHLEESKGECGDSPFLMFPSCKNFCFGPSVVQCLKMIISCILLSFTVWGFFFAEQEYIIRYCIMARNVEKELSNLYKDPTLMIMLNKNVEQSRNVPNIRRLLPFNLFCVYFRDPHEISY